MAAWDCSATANVSDTGFRPLASRSDGERIVPTDSGSHARAERGGDPPNMRACTSKTWGERMVVQTVPAVLTVVWHLKQAGHQVWRHAAARLVSAVAAFNLPARGGAG